MLGLDIDFQICESELFTLLDADDASFFLHLPLLLSVQHTSAHRNTWQHTGTRVHASESELVTWRHVLQCSAVWCSVLQCVAVHTATHCNILQHVESHCNTLQRTASLCNCNTLRGALITFLNANNFFPSFHLLLHMF